MESKQVAFRAVLPGYLAFLALIIGSTVASWLWPERPFWVRTLELFLQILGAAAFVYYASRKRANLTIKPRMVMRLFIMFIAYMSVLFAFTEVAARWLDRPRSVDLIWLVLWIVLTVLFLYFWWWRERKPTS